MPSGVPQYNASPTDITDRVPSGKLIGLDRRYALEMVQAGDVAVEYDKLIDRQLERAAVTSIAGFASSFMLQNHW